MSSESNTGISFVDDAVDSTVNGARDLGMNVERSVRNILQGSAMMLSGDLNNAGRTLLDMSTFMTTGGMINPDDVDKATGSITAMERKKRDMTEKAVKAAAATAASEAAAATAEALRQNQATITGVIGAQGMAPGKSSVLRGRSGVSNSLLTYI